MCIRDSFYGADARLSAVDVTSNHFRCGRARSAYFEDWAHFMNYDVGMCAPVPRPRRYSRCAALKCDDDRKF